MISIITTVRNHIDMNRLFLKSLKQYTKNEYELLVIDNGSTDGSKEFFQDNGARVIANQGNYSYPHCQNQGIEMARFDILAFFNNDLIVCPGWDNHLIRILDEKHLDVVSLATNDHVENVNATKKIKRRWKYIKYPLLFLGGATSASLRLMFKLMYGDWERWTSNRFKRFGDQIIEGFCGSCIVITRRGLTKIGPWDERIQGADFDISLRVKTRSIEQGDIRPAHILLGVYFHHYTRLTLRSRHYVPFVDQDNLISVEEKWGENRISELLKDIDTPG